MWIMVGQGLTMRMRLVLVIFSLLEPSFSVSRLNIDLNTVNTLTLICGWILRPFRQYYSHIRTTGG